MPAECKKYPEWSEAEKKKPLQWFENSLVTYASLAMTTIAGVEMWDHIQEGDRLYFRILAAGIYVAGSILDMDSTTKGLDRFKAAKERNIKHPLYEENPLVPDHPEKEEFMKHKKRIFDYVASGVAVLVPQLGLRWGVFRAMAALNNYSHVERLDLTLDIAEANKTSKARKKRK